MPLPQLMPLKRVKADADDEGAAKKMREGTAAKQWITVYDKCNCMKQR